MPPIFAGALLLLLALAPWLTRQLTNNSSTLRRLLTLANKKKKSSEIVSLRVYPIKSCRGFQVTQAKLCMSGLGIDRRWMIVDSKTHVFLTIRQIPEMTLITTALSADGESLILSTADKGEIRIPAHPDQAWLNSNTTLAPDIKIWDTVTDGYIYNPSVGVNQLFSKFLNRDVSLVYKGPTPRILQGNGDPKLLGRVQNTNFPDVHPVLVASESSITELNGRLKAKGHDPISIERFRPNIIVKGDIENPWDEDSWKTVRITSPPSPPASSASHKGGDGDGEVALTLDLVARCTRCQVPNVDPVTSEKHKTQPWDTLMSYRRIDEGMKYKPVFGMLGAPRGEGSLRVGMKFEVLEETSEHRYIKGF